VASGALCSPIAAGYYHRYAKWCLAVPRCHPMSEETHGMYYLDPERGTNVLWLQGSAFLEACEDEPAPPDLADLN
jgi:hypothetical protein